MVAIASPAASGEQGGAARHQERASIMGSTRTEAETMKAIYTLSDDELKDRAGALAACCEAIDQLDADRKEAMNDFKQRREALEKERARLARIVRTHQDEQEAETLPFELTARSNGAGCES
jgi:hypothetical protein